MIELVRVDHRLLHGQVAVSWVNGLGADCILVASDSVVNDSLWKTTLKLGKPQGCKLVIKAINDAIDAINSGVTDRYKMIVVVQSIADADRMVKGCPSIKSINLGNTKESPTTKQVSKQIFLEAEEISILKSLLEKGVDCEIRPMADDSRINAGSVI